MSQPLPENVVSIDPPASGPAPVVLDSPHSGDEYPADFRYAVDISKLREAEDAYVDELYGDASAFGATLIAARFPRSYIDPNRAENDIDPALLEAPWPDPLVVGDKAREGVGIIWRVVGNDRVPIYDRRLSVEEIRQRIEGYWRPYHAVVRTALDDAYSRFGAVWHINCHSTPSVWPPGYPKAGRPYDNDFTLGDRDGTTSGAEFTDFVRETLAAQGYKVAVNDGQKGVELVRAYSNPARRRHSLQIEVNRRLYMDERSFEKTAGFAGQRAALTRLVESVCAYARRATGQ